MTKQIVTFWGKNKVTPSVTASNVVYHEHTLYATCTDQGQEMP